MCCRRWKRNRSSNKSGAFPFQSLSTTRFHLLSTSPCAPRSSWPKSNISSNRKENKQYCQSTKGHHQNPEQAIGYLGGIVRLLDGIACNILQCFIYLFMICSQCQKQTERLDLQGTRACRICWVIDSRVPCTSATRTSLVTPAVRLAVDTVAAALWLTLKAGLLYDNALHHGAGHGH